MWSILQNVPSPLDKKVHFSALGWKVLKISIRSIWSNVSFMVYVSLLIFCFDDMSIVNTPYNYCVLTSLTIILLLSVSPFMCVAAATAAKSRQSCLTLCDPIDGSRTGSSVPGILQARILEWVAISFSSA